MFFLSCYWTKWLNSVLFPFEKIYLVEIDVLVQLQINKKDYNCVAGDLL